MENLQGTEKQVVWAESIREEAIRSPKAAKCQAYKEWLEQQTSAKFFIENRVDLYHTFEADFYLGKLEGAELPQEIKVKALAEFKKRFSAVLADNADYAKRFETL